MPDPTPLRRAIARGMARRKVTRYWLARACNLNHTRLCAYLDGPGQSLGSESIERIMDVLGLQVVPRVPRPRPSPAAK